MKIYQQEHLAQSVVMVHPTDFGFNEQTGLDNEFQRRPGASQIAQIKNQAAKEFDAMVDQLSKAGVEVITLDRAQSAEPQPDAVFPNNWFSTRQDGKLVIYPMKTANRQAEVQIDNLLAQLCRAGYSCRELVDWRSQPDFKQKALEGTGSLIFHHPSGSCFAAISERCNRPSFLHYCATLNYAAYPFQSQSVSGKPIYHSNVLMSCGDDFTVIASDVIVKNPSAKTALTALRDRVNDWIEISQAQMAESFCANLLQLKNDHGQACIVLSESAYRGFTPAQIKPLEKHGLLIICSIPTIERVGGGSARCMIAENFLPKAN